MFFYQHLTSFNRFLQKVGTILSANLKLGSFTTMIVFPTTFVKSHSRLQDQGSILVDTTWLCFSFPFPLQIHDGGIQVGNYTLCHQLAAIAWSV